VRVHSDATKRSYHNVHRWWAALALLSMAVVAGRLPKAQAGPPALRHLYTTDRFKGNLHFISPGAVFLDARRREIYVADAGAMRVVTLSADGRSLGSFYHRQKGQDTNSEPMGVAVNSEGTVFVADALLGRVYTYDYQGNPTGFLTMPPDGAGSLPGKMALDSAGNLYVAIRSSGRIAVFGSDGRLKRQITGAASGDMKACCDVAVDAAGSVFALSPSGTAVHVFNKDGLLVREFGRHEPGKAGFALPSGLDLDAKGRLWVTDIVNQTLRAFNPDGTFIAEFGGLGTVPGAFFFPSDVCVDRATGTIFVVEKSGQRLQAFAIEER
jgi:tripartite motif-containing protein 71